MESSWSYDSVDKGFMLSTETVPPTDFPNSRTKAEFVNWGLKGYSYTHDHNSFENKQGSLEVGFTDMIRKQSSHDSMRNYLSGGDEESSSRLSHSAVKSSCKDSTLIDLKLGGFGDSLSYNAPVFMSCTDSSTPSKRVKVSNHHSNSPVCQVYGCRKDLSSSKDYHKRHKVCEVHSKTAKVIVNDLEQRFCQQCSRFHLLGEFDDGKRSCRRRLAGHNERRRKPQVGLHTARDGRLFHSYSDVEGARPNRTTVTATSFVCTAPSQLEACGLLDYSSSKHIKLEHGLDFGSKLEYSWLDGQFQQKSVCPSQEQIGKQCHYSEGLLDTSAMTANTFNGNSFSEYHPQDNNVSCSLFQNSLYDSPSTVEGFSELSTKSGCALSLLSSQPQSSSQHYCDMSEVCEDPYGVVPHKYLGNENAANMRPAFSGGFLDGPSSYDDGATIDLLQLSTQLQRVEHQRQTVSVKHEDDTFCCLKIT